MPFRPSSTGDWELITVRLETGECVPARLSDCGTMLSTVDGEPIDTSAWLPSDWNDRLGCTDCENQWSWVEGCTVGSADWPDGTKVRWVEGIDCDGNPVAADPVFYPCDPSATCIDDGGPTGDPVENGRWVYRAATTTNSQISYNSGTNEITMSGGPGSPSQEIIDYIGSGLVGDEIVFVILKVTHPDGSTRKGWVVLRPSDAVVAGNQITFNYGSGPNGYYSECGKAFDTGWMSANSEATPWTPPVGTTGPATVLALTATPAVAEGEYEDNSSSNVLWSYRCTLDAVASADCGPLDPQPDVATVTCECETDVVTVDVEWICNETTGVFDRVTTTVTNGVVTSQISEPTSIECSIDVDYEQPVECRNGTRWVVLNEIAEDGTVTELAATDTGEPCAQVKPDCVKWASTVVFLDNTGTRYSESHEITVTNADGSSTVINVGPTSGWTAQMQEWASQFGAAYPDAISEVRCNRPAGCGGLLPPPSDAVPSKSIYARYLSMVFCPTDTNIPVKAEITGSSNPARVGRVLVYESITTPEKRGQICRTCGEAGVLQYADGTDVPAADIPACVFECAEQIPVPPEPLCSVDLEPGCDNVGSADPAGWVPVFRALTFCEGDTVPTISYYTEDPDGGLVGYTMVGDFVDCETGEPICGVAIPEDALPVAAVDLCLPVADAEVDGYCAITYASPTGKITLVYGPDGEVVCDPAILKALEECETGCGLTPSGICACYSADTTGDLSVEYVNADNNTDISASQNLTGIKWALQGGQQAEADAITKAIEDCITAGEVAHITWTDATGVTSTFDADTIVTPSNGGTQQAFYSGTGNTGWAGKIRTASLVCGDNLGGGSGTACMWYGCDDNGDRVIEWRDQTSSQVLLEDQVATLHPCPPGDCVEICPDCPTSTVQTVVCATEDVPGDGVPVCEYVSQGVQSALTPSEPADIFGGVIQFGTVINTAIDSIVAGAPAGALIALYVNLPGLGTTNISFFAGQWEPTTTNGLLTYRVATNITCGTTNLDNGAIGYPTLTGSYQRLVDLGVDTGTGTFDDFQVVRYEYWVETNVGGANLVTVGDRLLLVGTIDCEGVLQSSQAFNLDNGNLEVDPLPGTEACDPAPEVEEVRECIVDSAGVEWTQLVVIDTDGSVSDPIFINADTLHLGTPAGEPKEWTSCVEAADIEVKDRCFYDQNGRPYAGCEVLKFDNAGNYLESTYLIDGKPYIVPPKGLRGPFDCGSCLSIAGCFDPRLTRFKSVTFIDGHTIDLDAIYGVDNATSNNAIAEVTAYAGGDGQLPTEYTTPPSITCVGTNLHEFQFSGLSVGIASIETNGGTLEFMNVGDCVFDPPGGFCNGQPAPTDTLTMTPGGSANGGVCDADLLAWLKPTAGVKVQIKPVKSIRLISKRKAV